MKTRPVREIRALLQRASLADQVAERAAEVAREAERTGEADAAETFWTLARASRVQALKLRMQAEARRVDGPS